MRISFLPLTAGVACTTEDTVRRDLNPLSSNASPMQHFEVALLPVRATLFLCTLDALCFSAALWPSLRSVRRGSHLFLASTARFSLGSFAFVTLLRRAPPLRSFKNLFDGRFRLLWAVLVNIDSCRAMVSLHGIVLHRWGDRFSWPVVIELHCATGNSTCTPLNATLYKGSLTSCAPISACQNHVFLRPPFLLGPLI